MHTMTLMSLPQDHVLLVWRLFSLFVPILRLSERPELQTFTLTSPLFSQPPPFPQPPSFIVDRVIRVQSLDSDVWPARSLYYFGVSPPLFPLMLHQPQLYARVDQECHTSSIRPTTQIVLWLVDNGLTHHSYSRLHPSSPFHLLLLCLPFYLAF